MILQNIIILLDTSSEHIYTSLISRRRKTGVFFFNRSGFMLLFHNQNDIKDDTN